MTARCPICRKPTESQNNSDFPFCSERCRLLDLGNWASEKYKISSPIFDESELQDLEKRDSQAPHSSHKGSAAEEDSNESRGHHR